MWERLCILFLATLSLFALLACSSSDNGADGDEDLSTDGDRLEGDTDPAEDGDADEDTEEESVPPFEYASCSDPAARLQFPTPAWEITGDSPTGVRLSPPSSDKAAKLLKEVREAWHAQLTELDGFPLLATFVIPLSKQATSVDPEKIALFRKTNETLESIALPPFETTFSEEGDTLVIRMVTPLPPATDPGQTYVLALYEGLADDALPLPACQGDTAHPGYVEAATGLVAAGYGENLAYALPFTPTWLPNAHRVLQQQIEDGDPLEIKEFTAHESFDDFDDYDGEDFHIDAETEALLKSTSYTAILTLPSYQAENGRITIDSATYEAETQGVTEPGVFLVLPLTHNAPYPVVVFQHGGSRYKYDLLTVVKPYAERGIAMIGIDLPYHGDRNPDGGAGNPLDMADFDNPLKSRDNFRQASADHLTLIRGIEKINARIGDGNQTVLDPDKVFYVGHSLGSVSGTFTTSVSDRLLAGSLFAGGVSYKEILSDGLFKYLMLDILENRPTLETDVLLALLQTLLDAGDPGNYPNIQENHSLPPKDILIWESIRDPMMNNPATDLQATVFGCGLALPKHHDVSLLSEITTPASDTFQFEEQTGQATRILQHMDYPELETGDLHMRVLLDTNAHKATASCFAARAAGETCSYQLP